MAEAFNRCHCDLPHVERVDLSDFFDDSAVPDPPPDIPDCGIGLPPLLPPPPITDIAVDTTATITLISGPEPTIEFTHSTDDTGTHLVLHIGIPDCCHQNTTNDDCRVVAEAGALGAFTAYDARREQFNGSFAYEDVEAVWLIQRGNFPLSNGGSYNAGDTGITANIGGQTRRIFSTTQFPVVYKVKCVPFTRYN